MRPRPIHALGPWAYEYRVLARSAEYLAAGTVVSVRAKKEGETGGAHVVVAGRQVFGASAWRAVVRPLAALVAA